jgi:hypothetical protein
VHARPRSEPHRLFATGLRRGSGPRIVGAVRTPVMGQGSSSDVSTADGSTSASNPTTANNYSNGDWRAEPPKKDTGTSAGAPPRDIKRRSFVEQLSWAPAVLNPERLGAGAGRHYAGQLASIVCGARARSRSRTPTNLDRSQPDSGIASTRYWGPGRGVRE